jgi:hypothetical protein
MNENNERKTIYRIASHRIHQHQLTHAPTSKKVRKRKKVSIEEKRNKEHAEIDKIVEAKAKAAAAATTTTEAMKNEEELPIRGAHLDKVQQKYVP